MKRLVRFLAEAVKNLIVLFPVIVLRNLYERACSAEQVGQRSLALRQRREHADSGRAESLAEVGFRCYSQNDEDGVLLYVFNLIGATSKTVVEIGAGDGFQCNAANLLLNHGWSGLLVDGHPGNVSFARRFYRWDLRTRRFPPTVVHAWITAENVNDIIRDNGHAGEIDLLSIDVDGNDYWIWQAIDCVQPRVVMIECNDLWGAERAVTTPYDPAFATQLTAYGSEFAGASLPALVKLGRRKGYRLVGTEKFGFNAVFMRDGVGDAVFPAVEPRQCLQHPRSVFLQRNRPPDAGGRKWVEV